GVIDAKEIENAKTALLKLDKNKDGKLTRDEYLPPRPQRPGRPGAVRGQQGQRLRRGGAGPAGAPPAGPPPVQ
ncbi:MAG: hypothetical protein J7M29_11005, partial [Verrucomicrobia bacterium]|nr:hypothetical protein [Verrucomicrobiota bacterium]